MRKKNTMNINTKNTMNWNELHAGKKLAEKNEGK